MLIEESSQIEATLKEIAQNGYDIVGDAMLLDSVLTCQAVLERYHTEQAVAILCTRLLDTLENHVAELTALSAIARKLLQPGAQTA